MRFCPACGNKLAEPPDADLHASDATTVVGGATASAAASAAARTVAMDAAFEPKTAEQPQAGAGYVQQRTAQMPRADQQPRSVDATGAQQPQGQQPGQGRSKLPLVIGIVAAVVVVAIVALFALVVVAVGAKTHTVTYDSNGGSTVQSVEVEDGQTLTTPQDPTRNGYTFDGWYLDPGFNEKATFSVAITDDMILYAKWVEEAKPPTAEEIAAEQAKLQEAAELKEARAQLKSFYQDMQSVSDRLYDLITYKYNSDMKGDVPYATIRSHHETLWSLSSEAYGLLQDNTGSYTIDAISSSASEVADAKTKLKKAADLLFRRISNIDEAFETLEYWSDSATSEREAATKSYNSTSSSLWKQYESARKSANSAIKKLPK